MRSLLMLMILGCHGPNGDGAITDSGTATDPNNPPRPPDGMCQISAECYGSVLDEPKAPCDVRIFDGAGTLVHEGAAGFEKRGRSSLYFPKPQYSVELRDHTELAVWPGGTWRYLDDGSDPGAGWADPSFDDTAWSEGSAPLGYGLDYLVTELSPQPVTTYFRRGFEVNERAAVTTVEIGVKHDDGTAVYLNGTEILRDNLPPGAGPDALASPLEEGVSWVTVQVDPNLIVEGTNVLAVEVHQAEVPTETMRFDLYVEATGDGTQVDLFGMGAEDDWILNGQYVDRVLFRNRLAYDVFQSFGGKERYATESVFCELDLNGEYQGIYTLGERLDRDDERIDIGKGELPGDSFVIKLDDEAGFHPSSISYGSWQLEYPSGDPDAEAAVSAYLTGLEDAIYGPNPADPDTGIFAYLDLDSTVDWIIVNELMKNRDAYFLSVYLWRDEGGRMHFAPWDFDLTMGYPYDDCGADGWASRRYTDVEGVLQDVVFIQAIAEVPAFRERLAERWAELRQGKLTEDALLNRIATYDATLAPALDRNLEAWPIEDIAFSFGGVDNWLCPVSSYEEEHERVLQFLSDRLRWMDDNITAY